MAELAFQNKLCWDRMYHNGELVIVETKNKGLKILYKKMSLLVCMALREIKKGHIHVVYFFSQLSGKANKDYRTGHEVEIYPKYEGTRGDGGQLSVQFCVCDLPSNSVRQESCCE